MSLLSEYLADGASAIYDMDDTAQAVCADSSGNGRNATHSNAQVSFGGGLFRQPGLVPTDPAGKCIGYGSDAAALTYVAGSWHNQASAFSVALRFIASTFTGDATPSLIGKYTNTFAASQFILRVDNSTRKLTLYCFRGGSLFTATGATTVVAGTTYTAHATWDGTTAKVYLDGVVDGSTTSAGALNSSTVNLTMGNRGDNNGVPATGENSSKWTGPLDAVAYFGGTALSAARVLVHHQAATQFQTGIVVPPVNRLRPLLVR